MSKLIVRPARDSDRPEWEVLWKGYQQFYETNLDHVTNSLWGRLMGDNPHDPMCLVAEEDGKVLGFTHYLFHGSCWSDKQRIYLNDLFTAPEARGKGVGRALIEAVYEAADAADAETVYWLTQEFNTAGRALYDKVAKVTPFIKYSR
ncbi:MAG: GNAT family N-acetyltransferase [Rhizobiaceae bacterium]|nr:GNAT family N-acetyltransferase [Rhizobiaceae bacterium]